MLSRPNAAWLIAAFFVLRLATLPQAEAKSPVSEAGLGGLNLTPLQGVADRADAVAYAVPRDAPPDAEVVLPRPLPPSAVAQVKRILQLQAQGSFGAADQLIDRLDDTSLLGPILADRYLSPRYRSSSAELLNWYEQYNDQPEAGGIYQLLLRKQPRGAAASLPPQAALLPQASVSGALSRPRDMPDSVAWRHVLLGGIAAWQRGDIATAEASFVRAGRTGHFADERAAGAFWAARGALRLQQPGDYLDWLHKAAASSSTFYGMLAERLLGQEPGPTGLAATLTEADVIAVDATPDGHLAFALLQVGETTQAAVAFRALWPEMQNDAGLARAVMAVTATAGLVDVAIAISSEMPAGNEFAGMTLPMPALHPAGGFTIDPSLVYALARTESGFDAAATSPRGAQGLMQLMPATASSMQRLSGPSASVGGSSGNLALGQAYVRYLGRQPGIADNLLAILASYNAGPGAAAAWYGALQSNSDPLVFIETIPNDQTRHFVRQVLADSWVYAEEIGMKPVSLDDLTQGSFPKLRLNQVAEAAN